MAGSLKTKRAEKKYMDDIFSVSCLQMKLGVVSLNSKNKIKISMHWVDNHQTPTTLPMGLKLDSCPNPYALSLLGSEA